MSETYKKISTLVNRAMPGWVEDDSPTFTALVKGFFEYLEQSGNPYDVIANIIENNDVDTATDEYLAHLKLETMQKFPETFATDLKLLLKNIVKFYLAKGTEVSYQFFFRALYNSFVDFYYPKVDILRCSDGKWNEPFFIYVEGMTVPEMNTFIGSSVFGKTSRATAIIESVTPYMYTNPDMTMEVTPMLRLHAVTGKFLPGETVETKELDQTLVRSFVVGPNGFIKGMGYWTGTDGFLSSDKRIQDSYYYQDFSYVLKTEVPIQEYYATIKETLHPAGFQIFGELQLTGDDADALFTRAILLEVIWVIEWLNNFSVTYQYDVQHEIVYPTNEVSTLGDTFDRFEKEKETYGSLWYENIGEIDNYSTSFFTSRTVRNNALVFSDYDGKKLGLYQIDYVSKQISNPPYGMTGANIIRLLTAWKESEVCNIDATTQEFVPSYTITNRNQILVFTEDGRKLPENEIQLQPTGNVKVLTPSGTKVDVYYPDSGGNISNPSTIVMMDGTSKEVSLTTGLGKLSKDRLAVFVDRKLTKYWEIVNGKVVLNTIPTPGTVVEVLYFHNRNHRFDYIPVEDSMLLINRAWNKHHTY